VQQDEEEQYTKTWRKKLKMILVFAYTIEGSMGAIFHE